MLNTRTFDMLKIILDEATERFSGQFVEGEIEKKQLEKTCALIDTFAEINEASSLDIAVDDDTKEITISIVCNPFEFVDSSDPFIQIINKAKEFSFSAPDYDHLTVDFVFDSIWFEIV